MSAQLVLLIAGIVSLVVAAALGVSAAIYYVRTDIRGVKDDLAGKTLALEGRGFPQTTLYSRLPEKWKDVVPKSVWNLSHTSIDINARFVTDSDEVVVRWEVPTGYRPHPQITLNGTQGVDVYKRRTDGTWEHTLAGSPNAETGVGELRVPWTPGDECLVYLPMRVSPRASSLA